MTALAEPLTINNPRDPTTKIGPLLSVRQWNRVDCYIAKRRDEGSRLIIGGARPDSIDRDYFVQPAVFADLDNSGGGGPKERFVYSLRTGSADEKYVPAWIPPRPTANAFSRS